MNERKLKVRGGFDALVGVAAKYVPPEPPKKKRKAKSAKKRK